MADAERLLRSLLETVADDHKYYNREIKVKSISSGGANYTSEIFLATISAPGKDDLELFAKVAVISEKLREQSEMGKIFFIERFFYTRLRKTYDRLQDAHSVPDEHRLRFPKYYAHNADYLEEIIVLENLQRNGFKMWDRFKSVDWEYASKAVTELAKLHALSFAYEHEQPEEFSKDLEALKIDMTNVEQAEKAWQSMQQTALQATREEYRERLTTFLDGNKDIFLKMYRPVRRPVLMHSDFRQSNMMHKEKHDGSLEVIVLDYQTLQAGCALTDLMYFVFNSTDGDFRKQHFEALLQHYYQELCAALRRLGVDPELVYSKKDFDYEYEQVLPFGLCIGVFTLQIVTVAEADAPRMDGDADMSNFSVKTSDLYAERLNDIVEDYIKWGVL